jgi:hypothetical protein
MLLEIKVNVPYLTQQSKLNNSKQNKTLIKREQHLTTTKIIKYNEVTIKNKRFHPK